MGPRMRANGKAATSLRPEGFRGYSSQAGRRTPKCRADAQTLWQGVASQKVHLRRRHDMVASRRLDLDKTNPTFFEVTIFAWH